MTRRWLIVCGGIILVFPLAAVAQSERTTRPPTLAERVAALGRSFKQKSPAKVSSGVVPASHTEPENAASEPAGFPQIDPRSLLPTQLFSRGGRLPNEKPASPPQSTGQPNLLQDATPRAGSVKAASPHREDFTLPGLGRSRPGTAEGSVSSARPNSSREPRPVEDLRALESSRRPRAEVAAQGQQDTSTRALSQESTRRNVADSRSAESTTQITDEPTPADEQMADDPASSRRQPSPAQEEPLDLATDPSTPADAVASSRRSQRAWSDEPSPETEAQSTSQPQPLVQSSPPAASRPLVSSPRSMRSFNEGASPLRDGRGQLLVENQTPVIISDIRGPRQILVGREATYELRIQNDGDLAADEVVASVRVPSWADVVSTTATRGVVSQGQEDNAPSSLAWHIGRLDARATEKLELKLIPRSSRPLELGMTWTAAPVGSRALVEVQEPQLKMQVSGPDEVLYGKPQLYRLTLSNPGTGVAENVKIELMPPGGGGGAMTSHRLGILAPGESKSVEVELTAREAGKLQVRALASAEGGLTSDVAKDIFCRKPELEVDWRGPEMTYAGTEATYFFRVRNPGTATANDVALTVSLPEGVELISASEGQSYAPDQGQVTWHVGSLNPGDDFYTEIRCVVHTPGENQLNVMASTATGDLSDNKLAETQVVALADLKLDISDPSGPVPVGEEAVYELHVQNRGANTAEQVNIVALFSEGIEPFAVDGAEYSVEDGCVTIRTIDALPAGRQITLRIRARAVKAGTHVFRAEVLCPELDIKLAAEETTLFFDDASLQERNAIYQARGADQSGASFR